MKGLFIPGITAEMFRNGCLESIEALMAEGEIYDIEYSPWIPVSERLPKEKGLYLVSVKNDHERRYAKTCWFYGKGNWFARQDVEAWMPLPQPYRVKSEEAAEK